MNRWQRVLLPAAMLMLLCAGSAYAQGPTIFFTDLVSGPNTGGQNNKGVFVTIYGVGFGSSQGGSTVTVGGGAVDNCPVWGAAWMWYQQITCQLGSTAATGSIIVTVNGQISNGVPFMVRSGNIFFVAPSGNDSNDGSFVHPWGSIQYAKNTVANGDTIYLRAGTYSNIDYADGASSLVMGGHGGVSGAPKAMLGYPGETATVACNRNGPSCYGISNRTGAPAGWWTFGELDLGWNAGTQYNIDWDNGSGGDGLRFIGNKIHGAFGTAVVLQGPMNGSYFLGNDVYDYWRLAPNYGGINERGYGIYYGGYGTQQNINVLWNRFRNTQGPGKGGTVNVSGTNVTWVSGATFDASMAGGGIFLPNIAGYVIASVTDSTHLVLAQNGGTHPGATYYAGGVSTKGIQFYGHTAADHFTDVAIANNQVLNNCMEGIAAGGSDSATAVWSGGSLRIFNNLIAGNGSCAEIKGQTYSGIQIGDSWGGMQAKVWNNTFYLNAGGKLGDRAGDIYMWKVASESFDVSNNIFFAQPSGQHYDTFVWEDNGAGGGSALSGSNNIFFANGNPAAVAPTWVSGTVAGNPKFVNPTTNPSTADFRLQADSPARNAGVALSLVSRDITGSVRPQESIYDIGAYEFGSGAIPPPPPPAPVPTATLSAAPNSIAQGQSAVLAYGCSDCSSATINGNPTPSLSGQMTVSPTATTTYSLTAFGPGGSATATATLTVTSTPPPPPVPVPTATLSAAPNSIAQGQSAVLTYGCSDCSSATINGNPTPSLSGQMTVSPTATTTYSLTAFGPGGSATATATLTVTSTPPPGADLGVTIGHAGNFTQGQTGATYTIAVNNAGGGATSGTVTINATLPGGLTATAINGTGWTCTLNPLRCTRGDALAAGASYPSVTLTVNVSATAAASLTTLVAVSGGGEQNTANDMATDPTIITVPGIADLMVSKSHTGSFSQGQSGTRYTIVASNGGSAATSGTVTVIDTLPTGLTATAISGTGWTCTLSPLRCTRGDTLAAGGNYPAITVTVDVAGSAPGSVTNTATVSGGGEQNTANDSASDVTLIASSLADLVIVKTHTGSFSQGQTGASYSIVASNFGNTPTSGTVTVTDTLPDGLTATVISGSGWTCTLIPLRCTRSNALAAGGSYPAIVVTVNVSSTAAASVINTATVSGGGEQNTLNDTASDLTDIVQSSPTIGLNPTTLLFSAGAGATMLSQTVEGKNLGGGTLGWTATVEMDSGQGWLAVGPTSGVAPSTLSVTTNVAGLASGRYTGRVILTALPGVNAVNSPRILPVQLDINRGPQINNGGIVNGASFSADGVVSPGSIAALFGQDMASGTMSASSFPLPVSLLNTKVMVNGVAAPLYAVSPTQINFQMPFELSGTSAQVVLVVNGVSSPAVTAHLASSAPGIFSVTSSGAGQATVLNDTGTLNSPSNPAPAGSSLSIYLTGMGSVSPPLQSGQVAGYGKAVSVTAMPIILIGGSPATDILFSGAAPGYVGLNQINVRIPDSTPPGSDVPLQIQVGGRSSNTVTIAVR